MKKVLYIFAVVIIAAAGGIGWYKYYTYKKQVAYQLLKATFLEDFTKASDMYTPATVVDTVGDQLSFRVPRQVIRNGEIYVDSEIQTATLTEATELFTFASTSLGMTPFSIPPGTPIRIQVEPAPDNPSVRQVTVIYVSQDVIYPPDQ